MEHFQFRIENHRLRHREAPCDTLRNRAANCNDSATFGQLESVVYSADSLGQKALAVVEVCKVSFERSFLQVMSSES